MIVFTSSEDYFFRVVYSRIHELRVRPQGIQLRERESEFRYTLTICFETFPFPELTEEQQTAITAAAKELDELRNRRLNPPEWTREEVLEFPDSVDGPWRRYVAEFRDLPSENATTVPDFMSPGRDVSRSIAEVGGRVGDRGRRPRLCWDDEAARARSASEARIRWVRYPRIVPRDDECAQRLKKRTLTNLYNERPTC